MSATILRFPTERIPMRLDDPRDYARAMDGCAEYRAHFMDEEPMLDIATGRVAYLGGSYLLEAFIVAHWEDELAPFCRVFVHRIREAAYAKGEDRFAAWCAYEGRVLPVLRAGGRRWAA
jgi:hypothetical protein